jgi:D-3-phosphoglycerate dehydrogenase / 2-oxoglutarate reductase
MWPEMVERPLVYVLEQIAPSAVATLRQSCDVVEPGDPRRDRWPEDADGIIVRTSKVTADLLKTAVRLKVVGKHGVGVDNIDLDAARAQGIAVISTPGANANAVAELAVGLALSVARRISLLDRVLREGGLNGTPPQGFELSGRTVGVVGMGSVGRRTAMLFKNAFGAPLLAFDPFAPDSAFNEVGAERHTSLDAMLAQVDVLTLHIPLSPDTADLIDGRRLGLMRREAILLNLSRGGIVDETALHAALEGGSIAGAASDVFVEEPPAKDHPLLSLGNFVATPHVGAATAESMERMGMDAVAGVVAVLCGGTPRHRVV